MKPPSSQFLLAATLSAVLTPAAHAQVKDYPDIKFPALPGFNIPKPTVSTLKNGRKLFLLENHELPLIEVTARIRTVSNYNPAEKAGLARLTGSVLRTGGTSHRTGDQIDDFLA